MYSFFLHPVNEYVLGTLSTRPMLNTEHDRPVPSWQELPGQQNRATNKTETSGYEVLAFLNQMKETHMHCCYLTVFRKDSEMGGESLQTFWLGWDFLRPSSNHGKILSSWICDGWCRRERHFFLIRGVAHGRLPILQWIGYTQAHPGSSNGTQW